MPLMLRLALIENLSHLAVAVDRRQHEHERADLWANRLLVAARREADQLLFILAELAREQPNPSPYFADRLVSQLQGESIALDPIRGWLERKLGAPVPEVIQHEQLRHAADQVTIANAIGSLRRLSNVDWRDIFESTSKVHRLLSQDPAGIYPEMDFGTRDRYRHVVEEIARQAKRHEVEVATWPSSWPAGARRRASRAPRRLPPHRRAPGARARAGCPAPADLAPGALGAGPPRPGLRRRHRPADRPPGLAGPGRGPRLGRRAGGAAGDRGAGPAPRQRGGAADRQLPDRPPPAAPCAAQARLRGRRPGRLAHAGGGADAAPLPGGGAGGPGTAGDPLPGQPGPQLPLRPPGRLPGRPPAGDAGGRLPAGRRQAGDRGPQRPLPRGRRRGGCGSGRCSEPVWGLRQRVWEGGSSLSSTASVSGASPSRCGWAGSASGASWRS